MRQRFLFFMFVFFIFGFLSSFALSITGLSCSHQHDTVDLGSSQNFYCSWTGKVSSSSSMYIYADDTGAVTICGETGLSSGSEQASCSANALDTWIDTGSTVFYYVRVQNNSEGLSGWTDFTSGGSFDINHQPSVNSVLITPTDAGTSDSLTCTMTMSDSDDGDTIDVVYQWSGCQGGAGVCDVNITDSCTISGSSCQVTGTLSSSYTGVRGSTITCTVMDAYDSNNLHVSSGDSDTLTIGNAAPTISSSQLGDSSGAPLFNASLANGDVVTFLVTYSDPDGSYTSSSPTESLYICEESTCYQCGPSDHSACLAYNLDAYNNSQGYIVSGTWTVPADWSGSSSYYVRLYDGYDQSTNDMQSYSFNLNDRPYASDVYISPTYPTEDDSLVCNFTFNDPDSDTESGSSYRWYEYISNSWQILSVTSATLTNPTYGAPYYETGDRIMCGVMAKDSAGSSDDAYVNSSPVTITGNFYPSIVSFEDDSDNSTDRINEGSAVTFSANVSDSTINDQLMIYSCDSNLINSSGCHGTEYCHSSYSSVSNSSTILSCQYNVRSTDTSPSIYYIGVCDVGGKCSVSSLGTFYVNHAPTITSVTLLHTGNITSTSSNLNCSVSFSSFDSDGDAVNISYRWLVNRSGIIYEYSAPDHDIVTHGNTLVGDLWRCNATPTDGYTYGASVLSPWSLILNDDGSGGIHPWLNNYTDNSDMSSPVTVGNKVSILISWEDAESDEEVRIYVCNSSSIDMTGCMGGIFKETNWTTSRLVNVTFDVTDDMYGKQDYWFMICDDNGADSNNVGGNWLCTDFGTGDPNEPMGSFYVNHEPSIDSINLKSSFGNDNFSSYANLICDVEYSDVDLDDVIVYYDWYIDRNGVVTVISNQTDYILANGNTLVGDKIRCVAHALDNYSASEPQYSRWVLIGNEVGQGYPQLYNLSSQITEPVMIDDIYRFNLTWQDIDSSILTMFVCNSSNINPTGCIDGELIRVTISNDKILTTKEFTFEFYGRVSGYYDYWVALCDESGRCSDYLKNNFTVNNYPSLSDVVIHSSNTNNTRYTENSNLLCDVNTISDIDGDSIELNYKWFLKRSGIEYEYDVPSAQIMTKGNIMLYDKWRCEVTPYDGMAYGTSVNSSWVDISLHVDGTPNVVSVQDDADIINVGSKINFTLYWNDSDSTNIKAYICNSSRIYATGCYDYEFARSEFSSSDPINLSYVVADELTGTQNYWVMICDDSVPEWKCSNYGHDSYGNFTVNHIPDVIDSVSIISNSKNFTSDVNLICNVSYDLYDKDGDDINLTFRWYLDDGFGFSLYPVTSKVLTHGNTEISQSWKCGAIPYDKNAYGSEVLSDAISISPPKTYGGSTVPEMFITSPGSVLNAGEIFTMNISIKDNDSLSYKVYICNSSVIYDSGCWDYQLYSGQINRSDINSFATHPMQIIVPEGISTYTTYYAKVFDEDKNYATANGSLIFNRRPIASDVHIIPALPSREDYIVCNFTYDPNDVGLGDNVNLTNSRFKWYYRNSSGKFVSSFETQYRIRASSFPRGFEIMCSADPADSYGLLSNRYVNSTSVVIQNAIPSLNATFYPQYPKDDDDIHCKDNAYDADYDSLTIDYSWYINGVYMAAPSGSSVLYKSYTSSKDNISCVINVTDGYSFASTTINATIDYMPPASNNNSDLTLSDSPTIDEITYTNNSNLTILSQGDTLHFIVNWSDAQQTRYNSTSDEGAMLHVCSSPDITKYGCSDTLYCQSEYSNLYSLSCDYKITNKTELLSVFYFMVCDDSGLCSNVSSRYIDINMRPWANHVSVILNKTFTEWRNLECNVDYVDDDNDDIMEPYWDYKWFKLSENESLDNKTLDDAVAQGKNINMYAKKGDSVICGVLIKDIHNLTDSSYRYSAKLTFNNTPPIMVATVLQINTYSFSFDLSASYDYDNDNLTMNISCNGTSVQFSKTYVCNFTDTDEHTIEYLISDGTDIVKETYIANKKILSASSGNAGGGRHSSSSRASPDAMLPFIETESVPDEDIFHEIKPPEVIKVSLAFEQNSIIPDNASDVSSAGFEGITGMAIFDLKKPFNILNSFMFVVFIVLVIGGYLYDVEKSTPNKADLHSYLEDYISSSIGSGRAAYELKHELVSDGWEESLVDDLLDKYTILKR